MKKYKVYRIIHVSNGKRYIGLTQRATLEERIKAHFNEMTRKAKNQKFINPHSLQAAMYEEYNRNPLNWNQNKFNLFAIELIQDFDSEQEMINCEFDSIVNENTLAPHGYNLMNGGHSIGGTGRNQTISIRNFLDETGTSRNWDFNSKKELYQTFAKEYLVKEVTLRWRVNKFIKENQDEDYLENEIFSNAIYYAIYKFNDNRRTGGTNRERQKKRRKNQSSKLNSSSSFSNKIIYPDKNGNFILNSSQFSRQENIPGSTIRARSMKFLEENNFMYKNIDDLNEFIQKRKYEFIDFILSNHSNKIIIKFTYKNIKYEGTLTSLAKQFGLSPSTVKKRYKRLDEDSIESNEYLAWVFGLCAKPNIEEKLLIKNEFSQKNKIHEYILSDKVRFSRQIDFVNAVEHVFRTLGLDYSNLQKKISYYIPKSNEMSDIDKVDCIINKLEERFKIDNLKEKIIDNFNSETDKQA